MSTLLAAENAHLLAEQAQQAAGGALVAAIAVVTSAPGGMPDMASLHAELLAASQQQQSAQEYLRQANDSLRGAKPTLEAAMHSLVSAQAAARAPAYGAPPPAYGSAAQTYDPSHGTKRTLDGDAKVAMYKTVLCKGFASEAGCPYGAKCKFAHGQEELRARPAPAPPSAPPTSQQYAPPPTSQQYAPPSAYFSGMAAADPYAYGSNPMPPPDPYFAARQPPPADPYARQPAAADAYVRQGTAGAPSPRTWKTTLCKHHAVGRCTYGDRCNFAHGMEELQAKVDEFGRPMPPRPH